MKPCRLLAALFALLTQLSAEAFGQTDADKATARELAKEGSAALEKKDFAVAADRFARANSMFHAPTLVVGLARAQVGLGKLVEAQENYYDVLREGLPPNAPEAYVGALNDAKKDLQALSPQVPWVIVKLDGVSDTIDVKITVDGGDFPNAAIGIRRAINPGNHTIRAAAKGFRPAEKAFSVAVATTVSVDLTLDPAPPEPLLDKRPPPVAEPSGGLFPHQDAVGIVALGLGSASAVAGVVTGVLALGKRSDLVDGGCTESAGCPPSQQENLSDYHMLGILSTATFIGAGVGVAAGIVLLVTAPKAPKEAVSAVSTKPVGIQVTPFVGVGQVGLLGKF